MSVVTSLTAVPNRIEIIWKYLVVVGHQGVDKDDLDHLLRPPALSKRQTADEDGAGAMVTELLNEMRALGVIDRTSDNKLVTSVMAKDDADALLTFLEQRILSLERADQCGQGKVTRALAWFLTQDPTKPLAWGDNCSETVRQDCGQDSGAFDLTAAARFQQLVYWARYLGFAWRLELGVDKANVVFPDPTAALMRHLPAISRGNGLTPIHEVLNRIAEVLPVLEGGTARTEVESLLPSGKRRPTAQLSKSTSLALERLEAKRLIKLGQLPDATGVTLDGATGFRAVSHLTWLEGA